MCLIQFCSRLNMTTHVFNKVSARLTNEEVVFICRALKDDQLKVLCLRACTVGDKDLRCILQAAGACRSLQQLTLNIGMVTTGRHLELLAGCLHTNTSLTGLHIHGSDLGDKGLKLLGHALSKHPGIVSLDLGDCKLSDLSMDVLYSLLLPVGNKPGLTELTLSDNPRISALGWAQFGMCLANCNSLRWLFLDYNPLGDYGASCVLVAVAASQSVQVLDMEGCALTEHTGQVMLHLVQNHLGGLCQVRLSNNRIRRSTIESIRKQLSENHLDDSCSISSVDDPFSLNEGKLPALDQYSTCSSASSSTDSHSDIDSSSSSDDMKTPGHRAQRHLKRAEMQGKCTQSDAGKHRGKEKSRGLKKTPGNNSKRKKQVKESERQNGKMKRQNSQLLTGSDSNHQKEECGNSTHKSNEHKKHGEKKGKQSTTCRGGSHQISDTATSAQQAQVAKYDKKKTSVKLTSKKSPENVCSNDELQEADNGAWDRKHSGSPEGGDHTDSNNDKDESKGGSGNSEDELQEVPVFYK